MLERLSSSSFAPLVGEVFRAEVGGEQRFELVLSACEETGHRPRDVRDHAARVPFSLLFHAPDGRLVEQQIVTLRHDGLGELPVFLVPLGPDDRGMRYEAVFS